MRLKKKKRRSPFFSCVFVLPVKCIVGNVVLTPLSSKPLCCQVAEQLMTIAYESGVNLFDTAEVYAGGK